MFDELCFKLWKRRNVGRICVCVYGTIVPMGTRRENARMVFVTILGREPDARILGYNSLRTIILCRGVTRKLPIIRHEIYSTIRRNRIPFSLSNRFMTLVDLVKEEIFVVRCDIFCESLVIFISVLCRNLNCIVNRLWVILQSAR